jgi:hypothetical protein
VSYPNQPPPDDAYVVNDGEKFGSLETEAGIRSRLKNPAVIAYGKGQNNLWGSGGFLGFLTQGIFGIVGAAADFIGGILGIRNKANNADTKADTAVNTANGAAQTVVNVQKEIIQKIQVFDIKSPTPLWTALNRTEWPSIPWSQAMEYKASSVTLGQHSHTSATAPANLGTKQLDTTVNESVLGSTTQWYAFIVIPIDTALSGLNFYARGTPTDLRTRLYLMAATGDLTALTPESPNLASLLGAGITATPTNFDDVLVEAGSIVAVRFRSVGSTQILGANHAVREPPAGFYPKHIRASSTLAAGDTPDSIPESSLTWTQGFVPYVAVGNNIVVAQPKRFLEDNFDREDAGGLLGIGGSWSASTNVGIRSNDLAYITTSDGIGYAMYTKPLTTDYQLHGCRVGLLPDSAQSQVSFAALLFRCTQNRSTGLRVAFRRGSIILQSIANQTNFTNLVSTSRTLAVGDSIQVQQGEWVDEVFYPDRVLVFHNGIEIIRTDVPNSVVPYGPQRRYGGLGQERTPFQNSPRIQDWFESDISEVEPAA